MQQNFEDMKCKGCGSFECAPPYKSKFCITCIDKVCEYVFYLMSRDNFDKILKNNITDLKNTELSILQQEGPVIKNIIQQKKKGRPFKDKK